MTCQWRQCPDRISKCGHFGAAARSVLGEESFITLTPPEHHLLPQPTMSSTYPILSSRPIQPHIASKCPRCSAQLEFPMPEPIPQPGSVLQVRCFQCQGVLKYTYQPVNDQDRSAGPSGSSTPPPLPKRGRKIGTQENPLETGYYDILGVQVNATDDDIKKAYRT